MLSVGRKLYLREKVIICRECLWDGSCTLLQTGLAHIRDCGLQIYAYRCPECGSFDLGIKGKLIPFTMKNLSGKEEKQNSTESPDLLIDNGNTEKRHAR